MGAPTFKPFLLLGVAVVGVLAAHRGLARGDLSAFIPLGPLF